MLPFRCTTPTLRLLRSRDVTDSQAIRRRRVCLAIAVIDLQLMKESRDLAQLIVVKNDGTRQIFSRQKLLDGLYPIACEKTSSECSATRTACG